MQERLDRHATTARLAEFSLGGGAEAAGAPGSGGDPCTPGSPGDYHMGLHIVAVFALLSVSLLGSLLPVALHIGKRDATTTAIKSVPGGGRSGRRDATTLPPPWECPQRGTLRHTQLCCRNHKAVDPS